MTGATRTTVLVLSGKPAAVVATLATLAAQDRKAESLGLRSERQPTGQGSPLPTYRRTRDAAPGSAGAPGISFHRTPGHLVEP